MIRRNPLRLAGHLLGAIVLLSMPLPGENTNIDLRTETTSAQRELVSVSTRHTTLIYDSSLNGSQVIERAAADATTLGFPLVKTLAMGNAVVLQASPDVVAAKLQAAEGLPIVRIAPTYMIEGDAHPDSLIAFTSRVAVRFTPDATEQQKEAFYQANNLTRVRESSTGLVVLESGRTPDVHMVGFAKELEASPLIAKSTFEFLMTGRPNQVVPSDSLQIQDEYFPLQWTLFNDGLNTNYQFGTNDVDIDAPRAWSINQRNGKNPYGNKAVTVAVFDSGVELNHPDIAENLDGRLGFDPVDGGTPAPTQNVLGAHGTAMASIVAGKNNAVGIAGVAPNTNLYAMRIFGPDYSTTNVAISLSVTDAVTKALDVALHSYSLPLNCASENILVDDVEAAFRQSYESGRFGVGTIHVAAAGNFWSAVEYPASSRYAIAVGSFTSQASSIEQGNKGGLGIDITMPSYFSGANGSTSPTGSTGVVTADLSNNPGFVTGTWGSLGPNLSITSASGTNSKSFAGTSVSSALAAGTIALMLADERYYCLAPLTDVGILYSRADRRRRAIVDPSITPATGIVGDTADCPPLEAGGTTILERLIKFSDLRGPVLSYLDQYNESFGFGQPNPSKALAAPSGIPTRNTMSSVNIGETIYQVIFNTQGPVNSELTPSLRESYAQGWRAQGDDDGNGYVSEGESSNEWLTTSFSATEPAVIISPYLEPVTTLYFEDVVNPEGNSEAAKRTLRAGEDQAFFVWTDSTTTASEPFATETTALNLKYNPDGRYQRSTPLRLVGPQVSLPPDIGGRPMYVEIEVGHELGVQKSSQASAFPSVTDEIDPLDLIAVFGDAEGGAFTTTIARITGDSVGRAKRRLCTNSGFVDIDSPPIRGRFPVWFPGYAPYVAANEMVIRKYRYIVPTVPGAAISVQFQLRLNIQNNDSWLPTYRLVSDNLEQMYNVFRDHKGFIFYSLTAASILEGAEPPQLVEDHLLTAFGSYPAFSASGQEVMYINQVGNSQRLAFAEPVAEYLRDSADPTSVQKYNPQDLVSLNETITGLKGHPGTEYMVLTATNGNVYTITTDGVNQTLVTNIPGARDSAFSPVGNQIIVATADSIVLLNLIEGGSPIRETILNAALPAIPITDIRTPVIYPDGSLIFFTAVPKEGGSRSIYLTTRNGRMLSFGPSSTGPAFPGWEGINIQDLDLSLSGRRLLFTAETDRFPDGSGPLPATIDNSIFTLENLHHILTYGISANPPVYTRIPYLSQDPDYEVLSARYPRLGLGSFSPQIVYTALDLPLGLTNGDIRGRLMVQEISSEYFLPPGINPDPTPAPTPGPTPVPVPGDEAQAATIGTYEFENNTEGWEFRSIPSLYTPPVQSFVPRNAPTASGTNADGYLSIAGTGSNNSFGFWESPRPAFTVLPDSLYLFRAHVKPSGNEDATRMPEFRIRANTLRGENAFVALIGSRGDSALSPLNGTTRTNDLLFRIPEALFEQGTEYHSYSLSFDYLSFNAEDNGNTTYGIQKVEMMRLDDGARHYATFSFGIPDTGVANTDVNFSVRGTGGRSLPFAAEIRSSLTGGDVGIPCRNGYSDQGITFSRNFTPGNYVIVVGTTEADAITVSWSSTNALLPTTANCDLTSDTFGDIARFCSANTVLTAQMNGSVTKDTIYDSFNTFPAPNCEIPVRSVFKNEEVVYQSNLNDSAARSGWVSGSVSAYPAAAASTSDTGLQLAVSNSSNINFGFWALDNVAPVTFAENENVAVYRATFRVRSEIVDPFQVPVVRVRLSTSDFQKTAEAVLEPGLHGGLMPSIDNPTDLQVHLVIDRRLGVPVNLNVAFDLIHSYTTRSISSQPIILDAIKVEKLATPGYVPGSL